MKIELLPAPNQRNLELLLELADGFRQRRLRHVTGARGPREMTLLSERYKVLKLTEQHAPIRPRVSVVADRKLLRRILLSRPWELSTDTAQWLIRAGIGYARA